MTAPRLFLLLLSVSALLLPTGAETLRTLREVARVQKPDNTNAVPFDVCGQVVNAYHRDRLRFFAVLDDKASLSVANRSETDCQSGDLVHITGFVNRNPALGETGIFVTSLEILGTKPLPEAPETLGSSDRPPRFARLQGVLSHVLRDELDASYNWLVLRTPSGEFCAAAMEDEHPLARLSELIDAEVLIKGSSFGRPHFRKPDRPSLCLFGKEGFSVVSPAPANPFDAPPIGSHPRLHRQRASGTVLACGQSGILIRTDDGNLLQAQAVTADVLLGDPVTVVGFVQSDLRSQRLENALIRRETGLSATPESPRRVTAEELFADVFGCPGVNSDLHGKTIRIRGQLVSTPTEVRETGFFRFSVSSRTVFVDTTSLPPESSAAFEIGSTLDVTGVCLVEFTRDGLSSIPTFSRFVLVPRTAADLVLVSHPPWLTVGKSLVLIAVLALAIVIVLVWNRSLRILSERRGQALTHALTARVRAESRTQERTRLALELHDSISQSLTGVALQIDAATTTAAIDDSRRNAALQAAKSLLASCRKSLQDCLWDLRSRTFEEKDVTEAVSRTLAPFLGKCRILVRFNVPRDILSESMTHAILSIIRELTANAIRHGHATEIRIAGGREEKTVRFSVTDNGRGFDTAITPGPREGHFGLQGVRERVNDFNGELQLASSPGKGTKITVSLALTETKN